MGLKESNWARVIEKLIDEVQQWITKEIKSSELLLNRPGPGG